MLNAQTEKDSTQQEDELKPEFSKSQKIKKEAKSLAIIIAMVLVFRSVFFEPFRIPTGSMIPTLMIGDFILVNKLSYGLKVPFSDLTIKQFGIDSNPIYLFGKSSPERGDVIVFKYPKDTSINYIKRVIAIPGDTIEIKNKEVFVNGKPFEKQSIDGKDILEDMDDKYKVYSLKFYEVLTGKHKHRIQQDKDNYYQVDHEKIKIPKGYYFVMGDNRDFSYDSRFWGLVKEEYIKGEAMFVWFSMIFPWGEHDFKFRSWRIGTEII